MQNPAFEPDTAPLEVLPRDLSAYREGNTGIPYVHRFESGVPGPHVLINAITSLMATKSVEWSPRPICWTLACDPRSAR